MYGVPAPGRCPRCSLVPVTEALPLDRTVPYFFISNLPIPHGGAMTADQLPMLEFDIDRTRERLALCRRLLAEQLAPHGGGPDMLDELQTACDERGAIDVGRQLATSPHLWRLTELPPARMDTVGKLLQQLDEESQSFDRLVSAREDILAAADPGRPRIYPWFGRQLVLEDGGRLIRFADESLGTFANVETVPNRVAPSAPPDADIAPLQTRRRDRER